MTSGAVRRGGPRLIEESGAFLTGHVLQVYESLGEAIPDWAHLNWLAHGPADELAGAHGRSGPGLHPEGTWPWAADVLGSELVAVSRGDVGCLAELQRDLVIPMELALMHPVCQFLGPRQFVTLCLPHLRSHPSVQASG